MNLQTPPLLCTPPLGAWTPGARRTACMMSLTPAKPTSGSQMVRRSQPTVLQSPASLATAAKRTATSLKLAPASGAPLHCRLPGWAMASGSRREGERRRLPAAPGRPMPLTPTSHGCVAVGSQRAFERCALGLPLGLPVSSRQSRCHRRGYKGQVRRNISIIEMHEFKP